MPTRAGDLLGRAGGALLAPWTATISALRRARMFHPRGIALRAEVQPLVLEEGPWRDLAARLRGPALVRLSGAWWKRREWKDVLGVAIRFTRASHPGARAAPGDQDLLFATIRRPWTLPFAPLTTRVHDFFANSYYAVAPFEVEGAGVLEWRLVPTGPIAEGGSRDEKVAIALAERRARFVLEARPYRRLIDLARHRRWRGVAEVRLLEAIEVDQRTLRFDPFRAGRGIVPRGFVQGLRRAAYRASQWARSRTRSSAVVDLDEVRARRAVSGQRAHA